MYRRVDDNRGHSRQKPTRLEQFLDSHTWIIWVVMMIAIFAFILYVHAHPNCHT